VNQGLPAGAYESLHTRALNRALGAIPNALPHFEDVEPAEAPEVLAHHVADAVRRLAHLRAHPAIATEIEELLALTTDRARHIPRPLGIPGVTLLSHASYRREEILAGMGWANWGRKPYGHAGGVAWSSETGVDALLVTLRKEERDFSPTTRYRDYPIASNLFHWESQNSTSRDSVTGRRYLAGSSRVILFVRAALKDDMGSAPYLCLGEGTLVEHRGDRPIAITWHLHRPMPPEVQQQGAIASS
jgi:hypothetical protein